MHSKIPPPERDPSGRLYIEKPPVGACGWKGAFGKRLAKADFMTIGACSVAVLVHLAEVGGLFQMLARGSEIYRHETIVVEDALVAT